MVRKLSPKGRQGSGKAAAMQWQGNGQAIESLLLDSRRHLRFLACMTLYQKQWRSDPETSPELRRSIAVRVQPWCRHRAIIRQRTGGEVLSLLPGHSLDNGTLFLAVANLKKPHYSLRRRGGLAASPISSPGPPASEPPAIRSRDKEGVWPHCDPPLTRFGRCV